MVTLQKDFRVTLYMKEVFPATLSNSTIPFHLPKIGLNKISSEVFHTALCKSGWLLCNERQSITSMATILS